MAQILLNGLAFEYDEIGPADGPPFLMIMGFGTQMTGWPEEFREALAGEGLRVVRFDNRDVGLSQKWDGVIPDLRAAQARVKAGLSPELPYTLSDMAGDAVNLLDALGIDSAHILGASMGGMIAQLVAIEHPPRARSLISMFSTTGDPSLPRATQEAAAALASSPPAGDRATVIAHTLKSRRAYASTAWPFDEARLGERIGENFDRSYYPEGPLRHWAALATAEPRTERLKKLAVPALVLHGTADTLIPVEAGRHTAASIPGADYLEIEGWGHDLPLEVIPRLRDAIVPFVKRVDALRDEGFSRPAAPGCGCG